MQITRLNDVILPSKNYTANPVTRSWVRTMQKSFDGYETRRIEHLMKRRQMDGRLPPTQRFMSKAICSGRCHLPCRWASRMHLFFLRTANYATSLPRYAILPISVLRTKSNQHSFPL